MSIALLRIRSADRNMACPLEAEGPLGVTGPLGVGETATQGV